MQSAVAEYQSVREGMTGAEGGDTGSSCVCRASKALPRESWIVFWAMEALTWHSLPSGRTLTAPVRRPA